MDVQVTEPPEEPPPLPPNPPLPMAEDEEEYWNAFDNPIIPQDTVDVLPAGCPETAEHYNSYKVLQEARTTASSDPEIRLRMRSEMSQVGDGMKPRFYQEDCAEAFLLGVNTGLICATGSGKTEAFVLPLFADPENKSRIIIISPLNALQIDHAKRFIKYGITAAAVNGETYSDALHERLAKGDIRAIITSPEMMFKHTRFSKFFRDALWTKNVLGVVVDEAHCVLEWGKEFRRDFDDVDNTRAYMASKPLFFCTATLTPSMLDELLKKLLFPRQKKFILNLGCECHNVTPIVCRLKGTSDYEALDFILDEALSDPPKPLVPTLVYAEACTTVLNIWLYLMRKLPSDSVYRDQVDFLMSTRDETAKAIVLAKFLYGKVKILCSTEAAGMGLDARTRRVIQFCVPRSLLQWQQHAGRAGRDGRPAYALLLVEPSVFQKVVRKPVVPWQHNIMIVLRLCNTWVDSVITLYCFVISPVAVVICSHMIDKINEMWPDDSSHIW
ncbi:P-loop containing nucleoside triphosphate hydrolase protein [Irpex rosettiformis]|uniref:P-loop containing nucleoside triphosphate hydrolase protein n=1 Tax=Irpex rosettiformis TaxID=378272 RepID=A0ACB8TN04_9APHY|nr:P-loop containing nucleoside triphosphate hydrolase protein [Irpex rosettiformis]